MSTADASIDTLASSLQIKVARLVLQRCLALGTDPTFRLVESDLADELEISRSPVRTVLGILADRGLLAAEPRHGYRPLVPAAELRRALDTLGVSEEDSFTDALLGDRAQGVLADEVSESELTERYGHGRGLIRRVLMRLASDGLVERSSGHGWRFTADLADRKALQESYRFRLLIEAAGLTQPTFDLPERQLQLLRVMQQDLMARAGEVDGPTYFEINRQFHDQLAAASGNRFLYQAVRQQLAVRQLLERTPVLALSPEVVRTQAASHLAILDAIATGDRKRAARLMQVHLAESIAP